MNGIAGCFYPEVDLPTGDTLIDELADAMGADSEGNTYTVDVPPGILRQRLRGRQFG